MFVLYALPDQTLVSRPELNLLNCACCSQNPNLNFKEVTYELDHPGFLIRDSKGLQIVVYGIQRGLGMEVFPVDLIYRPWKHAEGQVENSLSLKCRQFRLN